MVCLTPRQICRPLAAGRLLATVQLFLSVVSALPMDYFPINSQLPPVARLGSEFSFSFSPITFFSPFPLTYSLLDAPSWLSIDSDQRTIYGTPQEDDLDAYDQDEAVIGIPIVLEAQDNTGSATSTATLVISRNEAPQIAVPLSQQIGDLQGDYSAPATLLFHPSTGFSFSFSKDTFSSEGIDEGESLDYYAVSSDWAPLPSWVSFDAGTLTFAGTTPSFENLVQPPQRFSFRLVSSDVAGFSGANVEFMIVVGIHELTSDEPVIEINATRGEELVYEELPHLLKIDDRPLKPHEVSSIKALDLVPWLSFDEETWSLRGTPEEEAEPVNVTVSVEDVYLDSLNITFMIEFHDPIFGSNPPGSFNITGGEEFSYNLTENLVNPTETEVVIESEPHASWLTFDDAEKTLSGLAPNSTSEDFLSPIEVTFEATSNSTGETETKTMSLHITTTPIDKPPSEGPPVDEPKEEDGDRRNLLWLLLPAILLFCVGLILLAVWLRLRKRNTQNFRDADISAPLPGSFVNNNGSASVCGTSLGSDVRKTVDIQSFIPEIGAAGLAGNHYPPSRRSNLRTSTTLSEPEAAEQYPKGTALTLSYGAAGGPYASGAAGRPPSNLLPHISEQSSSSNSDMGTIGIVRASPVLSPTSSSRTQGSGPREGRGGTDEASLWSDTSIGDAESHLATMIPVSMLNRRKTMIGDTFRDNRIGLEIPEASSIQPTPDVAYQADPARHAGFQGGWSEVHGPQTPATAYLAPEQNQGLGLRPVGHRFITSQHSPRQADLDQLRLSSLSGVSNTPTTRTSILNMNMTGSQHQKQQQQQQQQQQQPADQTPRQQAASIKSANSLIGRPTIVHIPSRPGEPRQASRHSNATSSASTRLSGQPSPLFRGRSPSRHHPRYNNNFFGLLGAATPPTPAIDEADEEVADAPQPPPGIRDPSLAAGSRESDSSWDRFARNSLGIAYKDLIRTSPKKDDKKQSGTMPTATVPSFPQLNVIPPADHNSSPNSPEEESYGDLDEGGDEELNWILYQHTSQDLMSPDQWPQPSQRRSVDNQQHSARRNSQIGVALTPKDNWSPNLLPTHLAPEPSQTQQGPKGANTAAIPQRNKQAPPRPNRPSRRDLPGSSSPSFGSKATTTTSSLSTNSKSTGGDKGGSKNHHTRTTSSRDERLRISKLREARALEQFRARMAQLPPSGGGGDENDVEARLFGNHNNNNSRARPPPPVDGSSSTSRGPLADRGSNYNNSSSSGANTTTTRRNLQSMASGKSIRTVKSEWTDIVVYDDNDNNDSNGNRNSTTSNNRNSNRNSNTNTSSSHKSSMQAAGDVSARRRGTIHVNRHNDDDVDDEDAWEDVRPPAHFDGWDYRGSDGSFAVYI